MSLPNADFDLCTWVQVGYSSDRLRGAWQQVFASYAQIFPQQYFSLALYPPLLLVSTTRCNMGGPDGATALRKSLQKGLDAGALAAAAH